MAERDSRSPLVEGVDYYVDELGRYVFTEAYHRKRGYCCENGCRHCPYGFKKPGHDSQGIDDSD